MRAADALLLPDLLDACLKVAQQQLSPGNALQILVAAHQAGIEPLKAAAHAYVVQHYKGMATNQQHPDALTKLMVSPTSTLHAFWQLSSASYCPLTLLTNIKL
jgi:hypothetical protein